MYDYGLRGMDASILALANVHGIKTVYTFDKDMIKAGEKIPGLKVSEPPACTKLPIPKIF